MKRIVLLVALAAILASAFFVVHALDDNDSWQPCTVNERGAVTCTLIERTARRGGEMVIHHECWRPVLIPGVGYSRTCTLRPEYLSHIIEKGSRR